MTKVVPNTPDHGEAQGRQGRKEKHGEANQLLQQKELEKFKEGRKHLVEAKGVQEQWEWIAERVERRLHATTREFGGDEDEAKRTHFGSCVVMKESNPLRKLWRGVYITSTLYFATLFPFKLAFVDFRLGADGDDFRPSEFLLVLDQIMDVVVFVELWMPFFCSYRGWDYKGQHEVDDLRKIAKHYLAGSFFLDFLGSTPFVPIAKIFGWVQPSSTSGDSTHAVLVLRMRKQQRVLRMFKLMKVFRMSRAITSSLELSYVLYNLIRFRVLHALGFLCVLLWTVHLLACGYYLAAAVATLHSDAAGATWVGQTADPYGTPLLRVGPIEQWAHAMYLIMAQFFGMDMEAVAYSEMAYACLVQLWGNVVTAAILGAVMDIMNNADRDGKRIREACSSIRDFAQYTHLNPLLQQELESATYERQSSMEMDTGQLLTFFRGSMFPKDTLKKVCLDLYRGKLVKNELFWRPLVSELQPPLRLILSIACVLKQRLFDITDGVSDADSDGVDEIYGPGDMPASIYLILGGTFAYADEKTEEQGGCLENDRKDEVAAKGASKRFRYYMLLGYCRYFGDIEITSKDTRRRHRVHRVSETADILEMSRDDFNNICTDFPHFAKVWETAARWKEWFRRRAKEKSKQLCRRRDYKEMAKEIIAREIAQWWRQKQQKKEPKERDTVEKEERASKSDQHEESHGKANMAEMVKKKMLKSEASRANLEDDCETDGQGDSSRLAMQLQSLENLVKGLHDQIVESRKESAKVQSDSRSEREELRQELVKVQSDREELRRELAQLRSDNAAQLQMLRRALNVEDAECMN